MSTYEKIAFYKLVSRKELEGIADERGRAGRQVRVKQRREERMSEPHALGESSEMRTRTRTTTATVTATATTTTTGRRKKEEVLPRALGRSSLN